jgi:hypothetical protein
MKKAKYFKDRAEKAINEALIKRVNDIKMGLIKKPTGGRYNPAKTTVAFDTRTGKTYIGHSGLENYNPSKLERVHIELENRVETLKKQAILENEFSIDGEPSFENWQIENCGEFNAINNALFDGSKIDNLYVKTISTRKLIVKDPCGNCEKIYYGVDFLSELIGGN